MNIWIIYINVKFLREVNFTSSTANLCANDSCWYIVGGEVMFAQPMRYTCWHIRVRGSLLKRGFFSFKYENEAMLDLGLRLHHCEYSTLLGLGENFFLLKTSQDTCIHIYVKLNFRMLTIYNISMYQMWISMYQRLIIFIWYYNISMYQLLII